MVNDILSSNTIVSNEIQLDKTTKLGNNVILNGSGEIRENVIIGNGVILEGNFIIDAGTRIDDYTVIRGNVNIGKKNWIYPFCTIGTGPQHLLHPENREIIYDISKGKIVIGSNNIIREYSTVHLPTIETTTQIGSDCYIMAYCHVAHDCIVGNHVIMANQTTLGGHVHIDDYANIGLNVAIHQFCKIGKYSMVGMGNTIVKDVLPFSTMINQKFVKINKIGLERNHIDSQDIEQIENMYKNFIMGRIDNKKWHEKIINDFIMGSKRGFYPPDFL